jgi:hypothetical protein
VYEAAITDPELETFFSRDWKERPNGNGRFFLGIRQYQRSKRPDRVAGRRTATTPYIARAGLSTGPSIADFVKNFTSLSQVQCFQ